MTEPVIDSNLEILYEDDKCLVVNKSGNCPVHEGGLYYENTLTRMLEKRYKSRFYPVYRLDRETSGIIVFAKNSKDVKDLIISGKEYAAVSEGIITKEILIDAPLGEVKGDYVNWKIGVCEDGRKAATLVKPEKLLSNATLIRVFPKTGRQHQIRAHLKHANHPIIGDKLYGESDKIFKDYLDGKKLKLLINRQALHLEKIKLLGREVTAPIPNDMQMLIKKLSLGKMRNQLTL